MHECIINGKEKQIENHITKDNKQTNKISNNTFKECNCKTI